jgi:hypothetical protein
MLIVALVLAVIGLAALVTAVVTSNAVVAWVCIGASVLGVILLIVDAIRERQRGVAEASAGTDEAQSGEAIDATYQNFDAEYPDEDPSTQVIEGGPATEKLANSLDDTPDEQTGGTPDEAKPAST